MSYTITDIAQFAFENLDAPSDISIPSITFFLRSKIGEVNMLLQTSYSINETTLEFSPDLDMESIAVFQKIYCIYYYDKLIRGGLGVSAFDAILEVDSDGSSVKKVNRNEVAKTYLQLRKDTKMELDQIVNGYKLKNNIPSQVAGSDYIAAGETTDTQYPKNWGGWRKPYYIN